MEIKKELVKRSIAGDVLLVPIGSASAELKGLITLNETGETIWDALPTACGPADLVKAITDVYEIDEETARADVEAFVAKLRELGIL